MKILVISDIHANIDSLYAVERREKTWDAVWVLGDVVDFGFNAHETVQWMREHKAVAVMGNHDRALLQMIDDGVSIPPAQEATSFALMNLAQMTAEDVEWLRQQPEERVVTADGITYYMAHTYDESRGQQEMQEVLQFKADAFINGLWREKVGEPKAGDRRRVIFGHTHQCYALIVRSNVMMLNPGSLSYRIGPDTETIKGADYLVIDNGEVSLRHVDYDTSHLLKKVDESALTGFSAQAGKLFYSPDPLA